MLSKAILNQSIVYQLRNTQIATRFYNKVLQKDTLSDQVKKAEYAVRGKIPLRGEEIQNEIRMGKGAAYNF